MPRGTIEAARAARSETNPKRTLIYIPIVHTQADMGALAESINRLKIKKLGRKSWERNLDLVDKLWSQIEQTIESLALAYEQVRLYQDGLPVCGREAEIVTDLAKGGSRNYQLLVRLGQKGATLMGTESPDLLVEEYQQAKQTFATEKTGISLQGEIRRKSSRDPLLVRRDQFIAQRINTTLQPLETGLLFIGMLHSVGPWLDRDIHVVQPIHPLPA
ncbi:MAG: hypothetical protein LAO21_14485 [Acidobacteriia bacterium]|nr:hypothetical protein [Terriglobia bacterium]